MFKKDTEVGQAKCKCCFGRLCVVGIALAAGIVNALGVFLLGVMGQNNFGVPMINIIGSVYKGFAPSMHGALWGALWGFVDAFIAGIIFALIYNGIAYCCRCCRRCCCDRCKVEK